MDTSGEVEIGLDNESVDVVLLYDIFWYFPLADHRLLELLAEVHRVSKVDALISVYPRHIDSERLKKEIETAGFLLKDRRFGTFLHYDMLGSGKDADKVRKRVFREGASKRSLGS